MTAFALGVHHIASVAGWLAAGAAIGTIHFFSLRWNLSRLVAGRSLLPIVVIQFARFAAVGMLLAAIIIYFGALPLLAATLGLLAARTLIVRREAAA